MRWKCEWRTVLGILVAATALCAQAPAQVPQVVAVRAGRLFDPKSGAMLTSQVVLIKGERIAEVGPAASVAIPSDAKVIDLSRTTVLPGLIDGHVHLTEATEGSVVGLQHQQLVAVNSATRSLNAGFTTLVAMGSHGGGYSDVELRNAIENGLVEGPRILACGPILNITLPGNEPFPLGFTPFEFSVTANGPEALRAAVRQMAHYGVDHIKIWTTANSGFYFKPNGETVNEALPSLDEIKAIVDEAHRRGLWVASHTYGGDGLKWAIEAGIDDIQHAFAADDADIKMLVQKNLPITATILDQRQDEPGDLKKFAPYSRWRLQEQTWKKMLAAGVKLGFGSGSGPTPGHRVYNKACNCSHGVQAEMFPIFVKWGATPLYALRMATTVNAEIIRMQDSLGTIEKGKFADIIAVSGDPLQDITEMQRVKFVMKGGQVVRNDLDGATYPTFISALPHME
jgi:imidazolonepropionase-like amidohydrolase